MLPAARRIWDESVCCDRCIDFKTTHKDINFCTYKKTEIVLNLINLLINCRACSPDNLSIKSTLSVAAFLSIRTKHGQLKVLSFEVICI
jgi:hypothetical protein